MLRSTLRQTHDSYDADLWLDYDALYRGGKAFFKRVRRFLKQNPMEAGDVYRQRLDEAHYRCYLGGIVDYFASYLFSSPLVVRAQRAGKSIDPDEFYSEFKEDCDGRDNDLHVFLRERVIEAMTKCCAWWLVEMPAGPDGVESRAEWKALGLDRAKVRALRTEQVLDWEVDDDGEMVWAIVCSAKVVRPTPADKRQMVIERYDVYDREFVERFELIYDKAKKPSRDVDIPSKSRRPHGFDRVPIVNVDLEEGLWVADRVASPQIEHFRLSCGLGWSIRRTCYAMPVFNIEDEQKPPRMGAGYYIAIGIKEGFNWSAPPSGPYAEVRAEIKDQKDEIFRVVQMMALGVDNNAAAIGRSAESKASDAEAIRVVLGALGKLLRESVERTYSLLSEGRGEDYDWSIEGLDTFEEFDLGALVEAAAGVKMLDIPSPTLAREMATRVGMAAVPDADQGAKDKIRDEIQKNITDESVLAPPKPEPIEPDGDEGKPGTSDADGDEGADDAARRSADRAAA